MRRPPASTPTQITSDRLSPSSIDFGSFAAPSWTWTGTSISPTISWSITNETTYVPVSSNRASEIVSVSTVRSIDPIMRRTAGPQRYTRRPEGP